MTEAMNEIIQEPITEYGNNSQPEEVTRRWQPVRVLKTVLRLLLGAFLITTGILKLLSIDSFELYIYSFHLFNYLLCTIVARLVIMAELLLGAFLILKILYKPVWWTTMAMLVGFTFLLIYVALFRQDTNCHCMGDLVELNPTWSILKNIITMALMLLIRKEEPARFKGWKAVGIVLVVAAFAAPFGLFPMDSVWNLFDRDGQSINEPRFEEFMQDTIALSLDIDEGNYILGYVAAGCKYCKTSGKKLNSIVENNHLDTNKVIFFIWGKDESIRKFKEESGATHFRYVTIDPFTAIEVVNGQFPTFLYVHDGKQIKAVDIRSMVESEVVEHLSKSN